MRNDKNALLTYEKVLKILRKENYKKIIDLGCGNTDY